MAQAKMPLEFFLTLKNEHDAIATIRTAGMIGGMVATLAGAYFVVTNRALGAGCFIGAGVGAIAGSYKQKRYTELTELLSNVETYEVESRQDLVVNNLGGAMVTSLEPKIAVELNPQVAGMGQIQPLENLSFHHLMILAPTGFGKSTLAHYILDHLNGDQIIVDPHATPNTWGQLPVAGQGRNYDEIRTLFDLTLEELNRRYERRNKGDTHYPKLYILVDEFPAIALALGGDKFKKWAQVMLCEARKVNISLILLSQGKSVKTIGLEGQSELLENLTIIRGQGFAKTHARSIKNLELEFWLTQQKRPATVNDDGLIIPDLSNYSPLLNTVLTGESQKLFDEVAPPEKFSNFPNLAHAEDPTVEALPSSPEILDTTTNAVKEALDNGKPDSYIVMDILGYKGRKYGEGKALLATIKQGLSDGG